MFLPKIAERVRFKFMIESRARLVSPTLEVPAYSLWRSLRD